MLSCEETLEFISAALDGALTDAEQAELDEHLAHCPACSALFIELRDLHAVTAELDEIPAPVGFSDQVMARIAADSTQARADNVMPFPEKRRARTIWKRWGACAAAVAVVALGAVSLRGGFGGSTGADTASFMTMDSSECTVADSAMMPRAEADAEGGAFDQNSSAADALPDAGWNDPAVSFSNGSSAQKMQVVGDEASVYCGTLTVVADILPEWTAEYERTADGDYLLPAQDFYALAEELELSVEELDGPDAEYGLVIVEFTES